MIRTRFNVLLEIKHPIIQEGFQYASSPRLAAAVCQAGGLGVLNADTIGIDGLEEAVSTLRSQVDTPFALSVDLSGESSSDILEFIFNGDVPVVITHGAPPSRHTKTLKERDRRVIHEVSHLDHARECEKAGVDAIILRGVESGGFVNHHRMGSLCYIPMISDLVKLPVIAAGGIVDGRSMSAVLSLGAEGVSMGTRFIASTESSAHEEYKKVILQYASHQTAVLNYRGRPFQVLKTPLAEKLLDSGEPVTDSQIRAGIISGNLEEGIFPGGQGVGFIKSIKSTRDILREILFEIMAVKDQFSKFVQVTRMFQ